MNKQDCKKYIKRAYKNLINSNKEITPDNMEKEMYKRNKKARFRIYCIFKNCS